MRFPATILVYCLADCLQGAPAAPGVPDATQLGTPPVSSTHEGPSTPTPTPDSASLAPLCPKNTPDARPGIHVFLTATPSSLDPGNTTLICATLQNKGPDAFTFPSCTRPGYGVDDHNQTWGYDGFWYGHPTASYNASQDICDGTGAATQLAAGQSEAWNHQETIDPYAHPGTYPYPAWFHGYSATVNITITGTWHPRPVPSPS
ncbi:MAG: hypothetical protein ACYDBQ_02980 [Thermoplasmatota archaeon]